VNRIKERIATKIHLEFSYQGRTHADYGNCINLSAGGAFIECYDPPPVGAEVQMQITFMDTKDRFNMLTVVKWRREPPDTPEGMGVEFHFSDQQAKQKLKRYVLRLQKISDAIAEPPNPVR